MITREFTIAELRDLELPPDSPDEPDYFPDHVLADFPTGTAKYTDVRTVVFTVEDDDRIWAVDYEVTPDTDYGGGGPDNWGWHDPVTATAVVAKEVTVTRWVPDSE